MQHQFEPGDYVSLNVKGLIYYKDSHKRAGLKNVKVTRCEPSATEARTIWVMAPSRMSHNGGYTVEAIYEDCLEPGVRPVTDDEVAEAIASIQGVQR